MVGSLNYYYSIFEDYLALKLNYIESKCRMIISCVGLDDQASDNIAEKILVGSRPSGTPVANVIIKNPTRVKQGRNLIGRHWTTLISVWGIGLHLLLYPFR